MKKTRNALFTCNSALKLANSFSNVSIWSGELAREVIPLKEPLIDCCCIKFSSALKAAASSSAYLATELLIKLKSKK